jgi:hypothetical protein
MCLAVKFQTDPLPFIEGYNHAPASAEVNVHKQWTALSGIVDRLARIEKQNALLIVALFLSCIVVVGCAKGKPKTKLIYFGFDNRSEKQQDALRLAKVWTDNPPCQHWRATIKKEDADYQILFGTADISIVDRRGEVLYYNGANVETLRPHRSERTTPGSERSK